jgi:ubiquinone/menaquinone biosynthesis C-methylase UbiE
MAGRNAESVATFDKLAARYADKYFALRDYDDAYARLLDGLPRGARLLDLACGPGNFCAFAARHRPDLALLGLDMAPAMLAQARERVPGAEFRLGDCRRLDEGLGTFDAAAFCFGLSYLDEEEAVACLRGLRTLLSPGAPLLLTTITGAQAEIRRETSSSGDSVHQVYRPAAAIVALLQAQGFALGWQARLPSPGAASAQTEDLALLARA